MNAELIAKLIEELIDLKLQQHAQAAIRPNQEIARLLEEKRVADRQKLDKLRIALVQGLKS